MPKHYRFEKRRKIHSRQQEMLWKSCGQEFKFKIVYRLHCFYHKIELLDEYLLLLFPPLRLSETLSLSGKQNCFPREQTWSVYLLSARDCIRLLGLPCYRSDIPVKVVTGYQEVFPNLFPTRLADGLSTDLL
jgi:hypothetical protein